MEKLEPPAVDRSVRASARARRSLHKETVAILRAPEAGERLAKDGAEIVAGSPEAFDAYIRAEILKWAKVVKSAGIKPE